MLLLQRQNRSSGQSIHLHLLTTKALPHSHPSPPKWCVSALLVRFRHLFRISFAPTLTAIFKKTLIPLPDSVVLVHAVAMVTVAPAISSNSEETVNNISRWRTHTRTYTHTHTTFRLRKRGWRGICLAEKALAGRLQFESRASPFQAVNSRARGTL